MAITPRLDLRQSQTLVMTPQLQQAIKLLQLSNVELSEYIEKELEQNPLLEREDDTVNGIEVADEATSAEQETDLTQGVEESIDLDPAVSTTFENDSIDEVCSTPLTLICK